MKPIPGKIYVGKSGRPRRVCEVHARSDGMYRVYYQRVLGRNQWGMRTSCSGEAWQSWVRGQIEEQQA